MKSVTDYLDNIVEIFPNKIVYQDKHDSISFRDLRSQAYKVAFSLIERGLQRKPIIIFMDKTVFSIVSFLGVAYSGNFYTPIDTTMPQDRLDRIITKLTPSAVITDNAHIEIAKNIFVSCPVLLYDDVMTGEKDEKIIEERKQKILDTDILYVMFTSGSTGEPKGVIISHKSVINYVDWICTDFNINKDSVLGNEAALYFDLSIQDVYAPIKTGCTTILIDKKKFTFPADLMKSLKEWKVNTIVWVPSALCMVANMRGLKSSCLPQLKTVMFCGEVMPNKQLNMWRKVFPDTLFVNLYGPTEACDACMFYKIDREFSDEEILPIGYHAPNTEILLIDENMNIVQEFGKEGEICIRGAALSYGYYNDFEKTKEVFIQNPLINTHQEMIYKTGDIGKYNERGELEYVCRKDFQIKHLGHRIELQEIEAAGISCKGVSAVGCIYNHKKMMIVLIYEGEETEEVVLAHLKRKLPSYMIPGKIIKMLHIPYTSNGKVDRKKLIQEYGMEEGTV